MTNYEKLSHEMIRSGEDYVRVQIELATAADQRAVALGGILAGAASVVLGFAVTDSGNLDIFGYVLCIALSFGLSVAAGMAFYSARPVLLESFGNVPSSWYDDLENDKPFIEAIREIAEYLDSAAKHNEIVITKNAKILKWSMSVSAVTVSLCAIFALSRLLLLSLNIL